MVFEAFPGNDVVMALNPKTGETLWTFRPDTPTWNLMPMFPMDDTVVFQDQDGKAYRLGLHNGTLLWKYYPMRSLCLPAAYSSPVIDGTGTVYIGYHSGDVLGLKDGNMD